MQLLGWINPLPHWIQVAIFEGKLTVHYTHSKGYEYEYLKGTVKNPQGTIIEFQ